MITRFEDLNCWKEARVLTNLIYDICENERLAKDFSTKDQIKRASISVMNNIAEGFARFNKKDFIKFLDYSQSSCQEVKSMIYILNDRGYINNTECDNCLTQTEKTKSMILALIRHIKNELNKGTD